ncbi:c-type cytochrome [Cognatishimia sp. F0-27]|uniref:c-type cytochrome n=1 Tax=Cognatishimia sp. F0-27 TaxID=2816855 RepID=UPI001D0C91BD|nr:c-type cytochrome [Cognatishimia sp. F0-27]MCC1494511.1 c-type cytochrome [Cognatishimia sp. F0-27]
MKTLTKGLALVGAMVLGGTAFAQDAEHGTEYYAQYCATCHGMDGMGDGPLTAMMTATVPDLTVLSQGNDGKFPMLEVIHVIDGRTGLRAHGGPMPVYGALFKAEGGGDSPYGDVLYSRGKVLSIAYYLESIQQ